MTDVEPPGDQMLLATPEESIAQVDELCLRYRNWGRWGTEDQRGTLNFITADVLKYAATMIKSGRVVSCALPFNSDGPQSGGFGGRTNPVHSMLQDGGDIALGCAGSPRRAPVHRRRRRHAVAVRHAVGRAGAHLLPRPDVQRARSGARDEHGRHRQQHRPRRRRHRGARHPARHPAAPRRGLAGGRRRHRRRRTRCLRRVAGGRGPIRRHRADPHRPDRSGPFARVVGAIRRRTGARPRATERPIGSRRTRSRRWPRTPGVRRSCPTTPRASSSRSTSFCWSTPA